MSSLHARAAIIIASHVYCVGSRSLMKISTIWNGSEQTARERCLNHSDNPQKYNHPINVNNKNNSGCPDKLGISSDSVTPFLLSVKLNWPSKWNVADSWIELTDPAGQTENWAKPGLVTHFWQRSDSAPKWTGWGCFYHSICFQPGYSFSFQFSILLFLFFIFNSRFLKPELTWLLSLSDLSFSLSF